MAVAAQGSCTAAPPGSMMKYKWPRQKGTYKNTHFFRSAAEDPGSQPSRVTSKILWLQPIFEVFNQWCVSAQFSAPLAITFKYVMRLFLLPKCVPLTLVRIPSPTTLPLGRLCSSHSAREPTEQGTLSDSVFSTVSRTLARISVKNNSRNDACRLHAPKILSMLKCQDSDLQSQIRCAAT